MLHNCKSPDYLFKNKCMLNKEQFKNEQYQAAYLKKLQEQKEMREMLNKYYPWSSGNEKPRKLRNLRLEGLFPNGDYIKAKRLVSPLRCITDEHQFKPKNVRLKQQHIKNAVDSSFCRRPDLKEIEEYKKQLEKQIIDRKKKEKLEKENNILFYKNSFLADSPWGKPGPGGKIWRPPGSIGFNFMKSLGWSTEHLLKNLELERNKFNNNIEERYQQFKNMSIHPPNQITNNHLPVSKKLSTTNTTSNVLNNGKNLLLPPIKIEASKSEGEDLVSVLAKPKMFSMKIPLCSTDITRGALNELKMDDSTYLDELKTQMNLKKNRFKVRTEDRFNELHIKIQDNYRRNKSYP